MQCVCVCVCVRVSARRSQLKASCIPSLTRHLDFNMADVQGATPSADVQGATPSVVTRTMPPVWDDTSIAEVNVELEGEGTTVFVCRVCGHRMDPCHWQHHRFGRKHHNSVLLMLNCWDHMRARYLHRETMRRRPEWNTIDTPTPPPEDEQEDVGGVLASIQWALDLMTNCCCRRYA